MGRLTRVPVGLLFVVYGIVSSGARFPGPSDNYRVFIRFDLFTPASSTILLKQLLAPGTGQWVVNFR